MRRTLTLLALCCVCLFISSCHCPYSYTPCEDPPPLPVCYVPQKVKLALVLGGGGARGLAHIGVLEEFEKANIPVDIIIGCSAGSLVGSLYCDCPNAAYVRSVLVPMKSETFVDVHLFKAWYGLSQGKGMSAVLSRNLEAKCFEQLKIPLLTVSTDLYKGELITIGGGPIVPAVQASTAIPIVFAPIELYGRVLVDGGVIDPVPVRVAKMVDPEIIVAVDLREMLECTCPKNIFDVAKRSAEISLVWQSEGCLNGADFVIRPRIGDCGTFDDKAHVQIYEAGRQAALEVIPLIQAKLQSLSNNNT